MILGIWSKDRLSARQSSEKATRQWWAWSTNGIPETHKLLSRPWGWGEDREVLLYVNWICLKIWKCKVIAIACNVRETRQKNVWVCFESFRVVTLSFRINETTWLNVKVAFKFHLLKCITAFVYWCFGQSGIEHYCLQLAFELKTVVTSIIWAWKVARPVVGFIN